MTQTYHQLDRDPGSSKTVFTGHRSWLRDDDPWGKCKDLFDGETELRRHPRMRSGEEIDGLLKNWKDCPLPGKKQKAPEPGKKQKAPEPLLKVWKTRSVFSGTCRTGRSTVCLTALMSCISRRMCARVCLVPCSTCQRGPKMGRKQGQT